MFLSWRCAQQRLLATSMYELDRSSTCHLVDRAPPSAPLNAARWTEPDQLSSLVMRFAYETVEGTLLRYSKSVDTNFGETEREEKPPPLTSPTSAALRVYH